MSKKSVETVLIRIKRMGDQFSTCGIGIRPPERFVGNPSMKRLCPKLVPGQCVELPVTHPLVRKKSKHIEIVLEPEVDEVIRPWVFKSAEDAALANPSKSKLTPDQILQGLTLTEGAIGNAPEHRKKFQDEHRDDDDDDFYDDDDEDFEEDLESDDVVAKRASNRVMREEKEDARPVVDDDDDGDDDDDEAPPVRQTRRRTVKKPVRKPRKTGK